MQDMVASYQITSVYQNTSSKEWRNICKFLYTGKNKRSCYPTNVIDNYKARAELLNDYFNSISQIAYMNAEILDPIYPTENEF